MKEYLDIINMPHYELRYHPRMSMEKRAAQFAPFDALTGYKEEIKETSRTTTPRKILTEEEIEILNEQLRTLKEMDALKIKYFVPDSTKKGGKYMIYEGLFKKINSTTKEIIFQNNKKIFLEQIISIQIM